MHKNFDLSTGQLSRGIPPRNPDGNWPQKVARGVCFDLKFGSSICKVESGLESHIFLHLFFLLELYFPYF